MSNFMSQKILDIRYWFSYLLNLWNFEIKFLIFNQFFTKTSIFDHNFNFWIKLRFVNKNFDQNFNFWTKHRIWPKFRFLNKTSIFDQNFQLFDQDCNFWKNRILNKNSIFWPKFQFLDKTSIFEQSFNFGPKFRFLGNSLY